MATTQLTGQLAAAVHRGAREDEVWLRGVLEAVRPLLDGGHGVFGFMFDAAAPSRLQISHGVLIGACARALGQTLSRPPTMPAAQVLRIFRGPACDTVSHRAPVALRASGGHPLCAHLGRRDFVYVVARGPANRGVFLAAPLSAVATLSPRRVELLTGVAALVTEGLRIREVLARLHATTPAPLVVPEQEVTARGQLRQEVLVRELRAPRSSPPSETKTSEAWRELVAGQLSLVDQFTVDGRRYVIARRPPATLLPTSGLTTRERQVVERAARGMSNKEIGFELRVGASTVATHLASAAVRLGVDSRAELIRVVLRPPVKRPPARARARRRPAS